MIVELGLQSQSYQRIPVGKLLTTYESATIELETISPYTSFEYFDRNIV